MAVTKIKPVKSTLAKALAYIQDPAKTDEKLLVSSFACSHETADIEFEFTLSKALSKGNNLAHHLIQAFEPGEATPEQAHEIGRRLADKVLQGKYEYVLTTHIDKGHIHNHIMFCAASFIDHHKYISNKKTYAGIRHTSDELCKEYGLSVIKPGQTRGKHYAEHLADKTGSSWKSKLKVVIDTTIAQASDFDDFLRRMKAAGYEIRHGKHISFRAPGQERFTRCKTLGADYTEEALSKRIEGEYIRVSRPGKSKATVSLLIDIEKSIKTQQIAGYSRWAKINNLKEAAKTLNFLTKNGLLQYSDLEAKTVEVTAAFDEAAAALKAAEGRLKDMAVLMRHVTNYQQTGPAAAGLKAAKDKNAYRRAHESELIIHEAAARAIKSTLPDGGKLPGIATLKADHARLSEKKTDLRTECDKLKKQAAEYDIIKRTVESILGELEGKGKAKRRIVERF
jgi:hypothetical protein